MVGHRTDMSRDLVRPVESWHQFVAVATCEGQGQLVLLPQPNQVANGENYLAMLVIIVVLDMLLGLKEPIANLLEKLISIGQLMVDGCHPRRALIISTDGWGWAAVDYLERRVTQSRVVGSIVAEFHPCKPLSWSIAGHASEIHLDDHLGLSVRLQVEGGAHVKAHPREMEELLPKMASEDRVAVGDDGCR